MRTQSVNSPVNHCLGHLIRLRQTRGSPLRSDIKTAGAIGFMGLRWLKAIIHRMLISIGITSARLGVPWCLFHLVMCLSSMVRLLMASNSDSNIISEAVDKAKYHSVVVPRLCTNFQTCFYTCYIVCLLYDCCSCALQLPYITAIITKQHNLMHEKKPTHCWMRYFDKRDWWSKKWSRCRTVSSNFWPWKRLVWWGLGRVNKEEGR